MPTKEPQRESHNEPSSILTKQWPSPWQQLKPVWSLSEWQQNFDLTQYEKHNWRENVEGLLQSLKKSA